MQHKLVSVTLKSRKRLVELIRRYEREYWSVTALGPIFGGYRLVLINDGKAYEHDLIPVVWKTTRKVNEIITRKEIEGWQVCAIGECYADVLMILKREKS